MSLDRAYEEIAELIATANPGRVNAFRPSDTVREHVADLIRREKMEGLSPEEASELDHCMTLEHLVRLAKARARHHLARERGDPAVDQP